MPRPAAAPRPCLHCGKPFAPGKKRAQAMHCVTCQKRTHQCVACHRRRVLSHGRCRDCPLQCVHKTAHTVLRKAFLNQPERVARLEVYARRAAGGLPLFGPRGDRRAP